MRSTPQAVGLMDVLGGVLIVCLHLRSLLSTCSVPVYRTSNGEAKNYQRDCFPHVITRTAHTRHQKQHRDNYSAQRRSAECANSNREQPVSETAGSVHVPPNVGVQPRPEAVGWNGLGRIFRATLQVKRKQHNSDASCGLKHIMNRVLQAWTLCKHEANALRIRREPWKDRSSIGDRRREQNPKNASCQPWPGLDKPI